MTRSDADSTKPVRVIPERMCVTCRTKGLKSCFIRVYRAEDGTLRVDGSGKHNGRGAYVCRNGDCVEKAVRQRRLTRNLKGEITEDTLRRLREAAAEE